MMRKSTFRTQEMCISPLKRNFKPPFPPCPRSFIEYFCFTIGNITGCFSFHYRSYCKTPPLCFATQNIGEVARSDGGVENDISSVCLYPFSPAVSRSITGYCVRNIGETPKKQ